MARQRPGCRTVTARQPCAASRLRHGVSPPRTGPGCHGPGPEHPCRPGHAAAASRSRCRQPNGGRQTSHGYRSSTMARIARRKPAAAASITPSHCQCGGGAAAGRWHSLGPAWQPGSGDPSRNEPRRSCVQQARRVGPVGWALLTRTSHYNGRIVTVCAGRSRGDHRHGLPGDRDRGPAGQA